MTPFLQRLASAFVADGPEKLIDCCFVFPNKRSGTFFRHYLRLQARGVHFVEPEVTTVSDFISGLSDYVEASRYDLLFTLYTNYRRIAAEAGAGEPDDFDRFVFWGDMLVSDFNDVDRYMASPASLFRNVSDLKEISSDFLTDEQREVISRYWEIDLPPSDPERFWNHLNSDGTRRTTRDSFLRLWEILLPLYEATTADLGRRGLCFSGRQYREVAEKLRRADAGDLPWKQVIFVGFNVLSTSELTIFERLRDLGVGDFYWDFDFPEPMRGLSSAGRFLNRYVREFPSRLSLPDDLTPEPPHIEIVSVPSNVGQVKLIGRRLQELVDSGITPGVETAVVLPSENLFIELLHSISPEIEEVNITMGYPLRLTSIASLMRGVMSMHLRAKRVRDRWCYFHEDVTAVLSHYLVKAFADDDAESLRRRIVEERLFLVPADMLTGGEYPALAPLFFPVDDLRSGTPVFDYVIRLIDHIHSTISGVVEADSSAGGDMAVELGFLARYRLAVEQLRTAAESYSVGMLESTFFHLIERAVSSESVNFTGEPLAGLQIMGVLETRALDFERLIIPSMNERIFPRKQFARSFIPNVLRKSYGLSTQEFQESMFAYYFYRLISGARHVTLLYDSRTSGLKGGEMSRYLYQLLYRYPKELLTVRSAAYDVPPLERSEVFSIEKTPEIMEVLDSFLSDGTDGKPQRWLSASSINTYLNCPLEFYLQRVRRVLTQEEMTEYMDESVFGTIVHEVAERSYNRVRGDADEVLITPQILDRLIRERVELERIITSTVNRHFNRLPSQDLREGAPYINLTGLQGEAALLANIIADFIELLFRREKEQPFYFRHGEMKLSTRLPLGDGRSFNITGSIDRVDRVDSPDGGYLRVIDYKTGGDSQDVGDFMTLFDPAGSSKAHNKAVLQLFLYCFAYSAQEHYDGPIKPLLYLFRQLPLKGVEPVTIVPPDDAVEEEPVGKPKGKGGSRKKKTKVAVDDYRDFAAPVMAELQKRLAELFDKNTPFRPNPHQGHCKYCEFKQVCGLAKTRDL